MAVKASTQAKPGLFEIDTSIPAYREYRALARIAEVLVSARSIIEDAEWRLEYYNILKQIGLTEDLWEHNLDKDMLFDTFIELADNGAISYTLNANTLRMEYNIGGRDVSWEEISKASAILGALGLARIDFSMKIVVDDGGNYRFYVQLVCPACKSPNITKTQIIHHKTCGYTGAREEFERYAVRLNVNVIGEAGEPALVCPACGTRLRDLGVDYDVVGTAYYCYNCQTLISKPEIRLRRPSISVTASASEVFDPTLYAPKAFPTLEATEGAKRLRSSALVEAAYVIKTIGEIGVGELREVKAYIPYDLERLRKAHESMLAKEKKVQRQLVLGPSMMPSWMHAAGADRWGVAEYPSAGPVVAGVEMKVIHNGREIVHVATFDSAPERESVGDVVGKALQAWVQLVQLLAATKARLTGAKHGKEELLRAWAGSLATFVVVGPIDVESVASELSGKIGGLALSFARMWGVNVETYLVVGDGRIMAVHGEGRPDLALVVVDNKGPSFRLRRRLESLARLVVNAALAREIAVGGAGS